jgi:hypothetical protein
MGSLGPGRPRTPLFWYWKVRGWWLKPRPLSPGSVYHNIIRKYGLRTDISPEVNGLCVHPLRGQGRHERPIARNGYAKVQEWLGHANISTTQLYDRRKIGQRTAQRSESGIKSLMFSCN